MTFSGTLCFFMMRGPAMWGARMLLDGVSVRVVRYLIAAARGALLTVTRGAPAALAVL